MRLVGARATNSSGGDHVEIRLPAEVPKRGTVAARVTLENRYSMRVAESETVRFLGGPSSGSSEQPQDLPRGPKSDPPRFTEQPEWSSTAEPTAAGGLPVDVALALSNGEATVWMDVSELSTLGGEDLSFRVLGAGQVGLASAKIRLPEHGSAVRQNYEDALRVRDALLRNEGGAGVAYQVEYLPPQVDGGSEAAYSEGSQDAQDGEDARFLAGHERVWAYTQGIALAQYSRQPSGFVQEAQGLARYLCAHAEWSPDRSKILGWPFSWNTTDGWKDRRLVTGATAWVVHGLGVFLTSRAYGALTDSGERTQLASCYRAALLGLLEHRRAVHLENGDRVSLMTAGWTARGLEMASRPGELLGSEGGSYRAHEDERWAYYSVLDAIGYDTFSPFQVLVCVLGEACELKPTTDAAWTRVRFESEALWKGLRKRTRVDHVVTEHNVDVLAVLNHALDHAASLELSEADGLSPEALKAWRDEVRAGVFYGLWDDEGWKEEFRLAAETDPSEKRKEAMAVALELGTLGRVVTGGSLHANGVNAYVLERSTHSAIDNCSWLSLSVDYDDLAEDVTHSAEYEARLGQCLQYTVLRYVKHLGFGDGCGPVQDRCASQKTYPGAHYFQNAFRDPYIAPSARQASSYHLEATLGLILGLVRFAQAYPARSDAMDLMAEARFLWAGVQAFVRDHGFPYSSQRIVNLSTRLWSSTAVLWFIDVHDAFRDLDRDLDRPLEPYTHGIGDSEIETAWMTTMIDHSREIASAVSVSPVDVVFTLETYALELMVASARGDGAWARSRAQALLGLAEADRDGVPHRLSFPSEKSSKKTAVELLVYYAWTQFLSGVKEEDPLTQEVREALGLGLRTLTQDVFEAGGGDVTDLFRRPTVAPGDASQAALADNVFAFFALDGAGRTLRDPELSQEMFGLAERVRYSVENLCGSFAQAPPWSLVFSDRPPELSFDHDDYALCALFFAHTGAYGPALDILEATAHFPSAPKDPALAGTPGAPSVFWADALPVMARRALAPLDARQAEVAAVVLAASLDAPPPSDHAAFALLLADMPGTTFGLESGAPTLGKAFGLVERSPAERGPGDNMHRGSVPQNLDSARMRLAHRFLDVLGALLAAEFQPYRFDALFSELVRIRRVDASIQDDRFSQLSRSEWVDVVERELRRDLCGKDLLVYQGQVSLSAYLGMDCAVAAALVDRLFDARGAREPGLVALLLDDEDPDAFRHLLAWSLSDGPSGVDLSSSVAALRLGDLRGRPFGVQTTFDVAQAIPGQVASLSLTLKDAQKMLQERLTTIVRVALEGTISQASALPSEGAAPSEDMRASANAASPAKAASLADGRLSAGASGRLVDGKAAVQLVVGQAVLQDAFHRESPNYWRRASVELRLASQAHAQDYVAFLVRGHSISPVLFLLEEAAAENTASLRRDIHARADGRVLHMAALHGLSLETTTRWLTAANRALRTGAVSDRTFEAFTQEWSLNDLDFGAWRSVFLEASALTHLIPSQAALSSKTTSLVQKLGTQDFSINQELPVPVLDNLGRAFSAMVDGLKGGHFGQFGASDDLVLEFGGRLVLLPSKLATRWGHRTARWMDEVARLPPEWSMGIAVGTSAAAYVLSAEIDVGLETILVSSEAPNDDLWERVGVVPSESIAVQPAGTPLRHESEIRQQSFYRDVAIAVNPLPSPSISFEDDSVYLIQVDWLGLELPIGHFGVLTPKKDAWWPVYRLRADRPRSEIIEAFVHNHRFWQHFAPYAEGLPDEQQEAFLFLLELMVRGEFGRDEAERYAFKKKLVADGTGSNDNRGIDVRPHAPFFTVEPGSEGHPSAILAGRDGQGAAVVVSVPEVSLRGTVSDIRADVPLTSADKTLVQKLASQKGSVFPWGQSEQKRSILLRLYGREQASRQELLAPGMLPNTASQVLLGFAKDGVVTGSGLTNRKRYTMDPEILHQPLVRDLGLFWKDAEGLDAALGVPSQDPAERQILLRRLETAWTPVAAVLTLRRVQACTYMLLYYGSLGQSQMARALGISPNYVRTTLRSMENAGLVYSRLAEGNVPVYTLRHWVLFQFYLDLHRFLYKRQGLSLLTGSAVEGGVDRIVLPKLCPLLKPAKQSKNLLKA